MTSKQDKSQTGSLSPESRIEALGLVLPTEIPPVGNYARYAISGNLLFLSGHLPDSAGASQFMGKLGLNVTTAEGYEAAQVTMINLLGTVRNSLGDLSRVKRWIKLLGMVNCTADFIEQPLVINGASDLLDKVYGRDVAIHARSAVGMNSLPRGNCVEIEAILEFA